MPTCRSMLTSSDTKSISRTNVIIYAKQYEADLWVLYISLTFGYLACCRVHYVRTFFERLCIYGFMALYKCLLCHINYFICECFVRCQPVSTLCVSTLSDIQLWDTLDVSSLSNIIQWILYVWLICVISTCEYFMCEYFIWFWYVSTLWVIVLSASAFTDLWRYINVILLLLCESTLSDVDLWVLYVWVLYMISRGLRISEKPFGIGISVTESCRIKLFLEFWKRRNSDFYFHFAKWNVFLVYTLNIK